uniref:Uncharacterized protein n=1 Tax=Rhizophora mucronata TaxID=61149 RepID=A0A2P2PSW8_RHIMU
MPLSPPGFSPPKNIGDQCELKTWLVKLQ